VLRKHIKPAILAKLVAVKVNKESPTNILRKNDNQNNLPSCAPGLKKIGVIKILVLVVKSFNSPSLTYEK
jgi:hypothetical protein